MNDLNLNSTLGPLVAMVYQEATGSNPPDFSRSNFFPGFTIDGLAASRLFRPDAYILLPTIEDVQFCNAEAPF